MNYTLQRMNCKPLIGAILSIIVALSLSTRAYAAYSMRLIPNFLFDNKAVYIAENISPRSSGLASVTISYDSLADLVYYCNEHGLSTTLAYNTALSVYVGFVSDSALDVKKFRVASLHGLLGSVDGKVYVAERESSGGTVNNTYNYNQTIINPPSVTPSTTPRPGGSVSSVVTDRELQERIYHSVDSLYQYMSLTIDWLRFVDKDICRIIDHLNDNVVPALAAINNNIISFKNSTVSTLRTVCSVLSDSYDVQFNLLGVARSIYSGVSGISSRLDALITSTDGISSRLDSVISNGAVQVGSASLEARLDKLISMYSKVNSVVLDTASLTSNSIKAAVGGELEDVVFWGTSGVSDKKFVVSDGTYTLNGAQYDIPVPLLGFTIGTTVPTSLDTADTALMAGVWRYNEGGTYRLSDTYNAATGEYVRRVGAVTYDGSEDWKMVAKDGCYLFYLSDPAFSHANGNICSVASQFSYVPYNSAFSGNASDSAIAYNYRFTVFAGKFMIICQSPSVAAWKTWLKQQVAAGTPYTVWYQDKPTTTVLDRTTVAIPEGDSSIFGYCVRITGKYETYDSYTQTADIIAAINGIPVFDDSAVVGAITKLENALLKPSATVTADLTEVTTRLDTLIENSASKIENVTVNITEDNDAFNVFYITGDGGETQPITEFAKDLSGASGKFLSVLYRLVFSDALDSAGSDLGNLEDFFTSTEPVEDTATQSAGSAHEEVDIWSAF